VVLTCGLVPVPPGVASEVFCAEPLLVGLRPSHRLASRETIMLSDLEYELLGSAPEELFPAWALSERQALDAAGITPPTIELADSDLAASRWADQRSIDWILLVPSLAATHTQTVIRPVVPSQLVPFTLQWNPRRAHTIAAARFVHRALAAPGRDGPEEARPSPQDSTHMPPSGDAPPLRPLLPFTDEGNVAGRKERNGCLQARPCTARKPRVFAAGSIRTAGHCTLCRSGRALAGAGVSASGGPARYEIRVAGVLDGRWAAWFNGLQISGQGDETVICGLLADQPALHGLLTKVRDLGLCLISVRRLDTGQAGNEAP
jgi:hypothetical protein